MTECRRTGRPLPEKIQNAPQLQMGLQLYLNAFMDLNTCRPAGFGVSPIPWTAVNDYCLAAELSREQCEDMMHHIQAMDVAYCKHHKSKGD